jgi:hypothetical protein
MQIFSSCLLSLAEINANLFPTILKLILITITQKGNMTNSPKIRKCRRKKQLKNGDTKEYIMGS